MFPREQLLILSSEEFFADPQATLRQVFEFAGVDADCQISNFRARNVASNRAEVDDGVEAYLSDCFRPHNEALYDFLGRDFGWQE